MQFQQGQFAGRGREGQRDDCKRFPFLPRSVRESSWWSASRERFRVRAAGMEWESPLVHPLLGIGRRRTLRADGPKNDSGCTVDNGETLGQQAGISVIKLAVGKARLCFNSKGFTDHESGGFRFLLMQGAGYERPALDAVEQLAGDLAEQYRESLGGWHVGQ